MTDIRFYLNRQPTLDTREHIDFCAADAKGRPIGCIINRTNDTFTDTKPGEYSSFFRDMWVGPVYIARVSATRNGHLYGASQQHSYFRTEAEREAFIAKRIVASRKAAGLKAAASRP